jgi:hypothetical protein
MKHIVTILVLGVLAQACNRDEFFEIRRPAEAQVSDTPASEIPSSDQPVADSSGGKNEFEDPLCLQRPAACELRPVVSRAGVVTILMALGDLVEDRLVVSEEAARLIAQNAIKFASPVDDPRILVIKDFNHQGESPYDTTYIAKTLLKRYSRVDILEDTPAGLQDQQLEGYDLVWFNNPGYPMGSRVSRDTLARFSGGVVLSGDDLTQGKGFDTQALTGLTFINNGSNMSCNGKSYKYDNNLGSRYRIELSGQFFPGMLEAVKVFEYGNDIDHSRLAFPDEMLKYEVLARAKGKVGECDYNWPVIVRYEK